MTSPPVVIVTSQGPVCRIMMARPDQLNAQNSAMKRELAAAIRAYERDDSLLVGVVLGSDCGAFSVGNDLKEFDASIGPGDPARPAENHWNIVESCAKPLIAAIDGYCIGGGLELALSCDLRVATESSVLGMPEARWGRPGDLGLHLLSSMVPTGEALRMQLTGKPISARRAYEIGLVQVVQTDRDAMLAAAGDLAAQIIECSPRTLQLVKRVVRQARRDRLAASREFLRTVDIDLSADLIEGARAFVEKRPPVWIAER